MHSFMNSNNMNKILSIVDRMRDVVCVCINEVIHNLTHKEGTNNKISNYCGALIIKVSVIKSVHRKSSHF